MSIAIRCPKCEKKLALPDGAAGKRFRCPCGTVLRVGGQSRAASGSPPPGGSSPEAAPGGAAQAALAELVRAAAAGERAPDREYDEPRASAPARRTRKKAKRKTRSRPPEDEDFAPSTPAYRSPPRGGSRGRRGGSKALYVGLGLAVIGVVVAGAVVAGGSRSGRGRSGSTRSRRKPTPKADGWRRASGSAGGEAGTSTPAGGPASTGSTEQPGASGAGEASAVDAGVADAADAAGAADVADAATVADTAGVSDAAGGTNGDGGAGGGMTEPAVTTAPFVAPPMPSVNVAPIEWPEQTGKDYLSPLDVVADRQGKSLYITQHTANQVAMLDIAGGGAGGVLSVPGRPRGLAISRDGTRLYVACADAEGTVEVLDARAGKTVGSIPVGHTPVSVILSPDGRTLYVCNRFDDNVSVVDVASQKEVKRIPVAREPMAAAITPDGRSLYVANHLPAGASDLDYVAAEVSVIDTAAGKVAATIKLPNGSQGLRGMCVSPDGRYVYTTHVLARYQLPTTQLERGWMNTNALSVIDAPRRKFVNTVLLDDVDLGAANPWGVACTADGKSICVAHAGTHEISVIDAPALHEKLGRAASGQKVSDVSLTAADVRNDLSFLVGLRRRIPLKGTGPRGLSVVGTTVFVAQYFSDDLGVVDLAEESRPKQVRVVSLGPKKRMTAARKGEMLFSDASICLQQWQSCVSCHPGARTDGLNWDLLNDGFGNPKNAKSMLLAHRTPPVMVTGVRAKAEVAVRAGIKFILFTVRPEEEAVVIDAYLKSLRPVPSPYLVNGELSESAVRGKAAFAKAGCASCHPAPLYSNLKKYNVGTGIGMEATRAFDTPTLIEAWRTAPYLYDGRSVTLTEVLKKYNASGKHGRTSRLSDRELKDLAEFVLSL